MKILIICLTLILSSCAYTASPYGYSVGINPYPYYSPYYGRYYYSTPRYYTPYYNPRGYWYGHNGYGFHNYGGYRGGWHHR